MSKYDLVGVDGNAFSIMAYVTNALKKEHLQDQVEIYRKEAMSDDYNHLLSVSFDYIEIANEQAFYNDGDYERLDDE